MPQFQYENYHDPYAATLGSLIGEPGRIRAQQALQVGQARAQMAQGIGSAITGVAQDAAQYRADAPRRQIAALQIQAMQEEARARHTARIDQEQAKHADVAARIGMRVHLEGNTPEALQGAFDDLERAKLITPDDVQRMAAIANQDPSKIPQLSQGLMALSPTGQAFLEKLQKPHELLSVDPTHNVVDKNTNQVVIPGTPKPETRKTAAELAADAANPASPTQRQSATALDLMRPPKPEAAPKAYQKTSVLLDGKPAEVLLDPAPDGKIYDLNRQPIDNAAARIKPIPPASVQINTANRTGAPGDFSKSGEEFLQSIPPQWRATVKKIANYDEDPTKVASMRGGTREMIMQWVNQVNPDYDQSQFALRSPTRKAFTIGTQGQQINAINTAIGHIDQLTTLAAELPNGRFVPGNKAVNAIATMFGASAATNFDTLKDALAGEVSSVLAKGGATVSGIAEAKEKIHASRSPQQLVGYVQTLIPIFGSKLAALDDQYKQAMGPNDSFSALSATSKQILAKHGFDPAHPTVGSQSAPIKVGGFTVVVK